MKKLKPAEPKKSKNKQVTVTQPADLYARLRSACQIQKHSDGQLIRILVEWALPFYEQTRSVELLEHLTMKHFTSLVDKPLEQREVDLSLEAVAVAAAGR